MTHYRALTFWVALSSAVIFAQQQATTSNNSVVYHPKPIRQLAVSSAQELLDAVRGPLLQEGANVVIELPPGAVINLTSDHLTLKPLTTPEIATGSLTIRGADWERPSLLHLGYRTGATVHVVSI